MAKLGNAKAQGSMSIAGNLLLAIVIAVMTAAILALTAAVLAVKLLF